MKSKRLKAVAVTAVVLLMAMVSVAVLRPRAKQTEKPAIPVKLAVVEMNSAGSESRYSATIIPRTGLCLINRYSGLFMGQERFLPHKAVFTRRCWRVSFASLTWRAYAA